MSGFAFDSNILIDALDGLEAARAELRRCGAQDGVWISRMAWIEVLSKGSGAQLRTAQTFLANFGFDEINEPVATRAAALRRERPRLKGPDAIILASALVHGRVLVTRNIKDFPIGTPSVRVPYFK